jgi:hypothetical protein
MGFTGCGKTLFMKGTGFSPYSKRKQKRWALAPEGGFSPGIYGNACLRGQSPRILVGLCTG